MGKVVTVMNMKGGVGKTTVCMHIGGFLGRYGYYNPDNIRPKTLLIDYDPQFNMSQAMLRSARYFKLENQGKTCLRILQDSVDDLNLFEIQTPETSEPPEIDDIIENVVSNKQGSHIDVIISTLDLMYIALGTATGDLDIVGKRFSKFLSKCKKLYDLILIDCHPAGSILTRTSIQNSDHVLIPVAPQAYAARGVALMLKFINAISSTTNTPDTLILFNMIPRSGSSPKVVNEVSSDPKMGGMCLKNTFKKYSAFSDPNDGIGFVWSSRKPYSTEAFINLMNVSREFAERIKL